MIAESTEVKKSNSDVRAKRWDMLSVFSFAAAGIFTIVKVTKGIHTEFERYCMNTFGLGTEKEKGGVFEDIVYDKYTKMLTNYEAFFNKQKTFAMFRKDENALSKEFTQAAKGIMHQEMGISTQNFLSDWTIGTWQRAKALGSEGHAKAILEFATTGAIAVGTMAVLNSSHHLLKAINQKIAAKEEVNSRPY